MAENQEWYSEEFRQAEREYEQQCEKRDRQRHQERLQDVLKDGLAPGVHDTFAHGFEDEVRVQNDLTSAQEVQYEEPDYN